MDRTLEKNMCKLPDGVANSDVSDLTERAERYINPALRYACLSWHTHLVDEDMIRAHAPTITPPLHRFLETKFLFWLEVLSALVAVRNAVEALPFITDWLEVCQVSTLDVLPKGYSDRIQESPTLDLANDCLRFVTGYFEVISTSSPHIYHTALVVAPKNSIVRRLYESHARPFTRVVRGLPMSWDASTAITTRPLNLWPVVWSPCNRFIAISGLGKRMVEVLDSTTLQLLQTLEFPPDISATLKVLIFSPDSRILTCSCDDDHPDRVVSRDQDGELLCVVSWDLQTGGISNVIRWPAATHGLWGGSRALSMTYSANGKMLGVSHHYPISKLGCAIFICDVASGVLMHSLLLKDTKPVSNLIWTHGESLRLATANATTITIWEVGFTSDAIPTEVGTLPTLHGFSQGQGPYIPRDQLHPATCRFAFVRHMKIVVWDAQNSRYLLECTDAMFLDQMSFSSDGRFFACSTHGSEIYLWKESPTGYMLHGIFASSLSTPLLTQNGESILAFGDRSIQLWRTLPSSISTVAHRRDDHFIVEFTPDGMFAVIARLNDKTVTVLNLKSGVPQLTIDAWMEAYGLGVIGNTVVVICSEKVITWNLPAGYCVSGARVGLEDSLREIGLHGFGDTFVNGASISPDSRHIVVSNFLRLSLFSASTGKSLETQHTSKPGRAYFSPDRCNVWYVDDNGKADVWRVGGEKVLECLELTVGIENPPEGYPWASFCGYRVADDSWVLGPDGKRLLMLPPLWQGYTIHRVWKGRFLALLHSGLPEAVILEFDVNQDL
jgi:WD40 repeat protein